MVVCIKLGAAVASGGDNDNSGAAARRSRDSKPSKRSIEVAGRSAMAFFISLVVAAVGVNF